MQAYFFDTGFQKMNACVAAQFPALDSSTFLPKDDTESFTWSDVSNQDQGDDAHS